MACCSAASEELREKYNLELKKESRNRVQLDIPEREAPPPTVGEQLPRRFYIRRSVELASCGYTDRCIGCQHARLVGIEADGSQRGLPCQECQAHDS